MTPLDTSTLTPTSAKKAFPWRDTKIALLIVRESGLVESANVIADKRSLLESCREADTVLALRVMPRPPRPEVLLVDDREKALEALRR